MSIIFFSIHLIGFMSFLFYDWKAGNLNYASENGDGVRIATPADIVFEDFAFWEIRLLVACFEVIETTINRLF